MERTLMDLASMESAAMPVRRGDLAALDRLCSEYVKDGPGRLAGLLRKRGPSVGGTELFAASEALELRGHYRTALAPLEQVLTFSGIPEPVLTTAAARFGTLTIHHSLPADIGPIAHLLGIDGGPSRAKVGWKRGDNIEERLPRIERLLFGAHVLHQRAMVIGDVPERTPYLLASDRWALNALEGARGLVGPIADHLTARCLYHRGVMAIDGGDITGGLEQLGLSLRTSEEKGFPGLAALCSLRSGTLKEDRGERNGLLAAAGAELERLGNLHLAYGAKYLRGQSLCVESASAKDLSEGILLMLDAAEGLEASGHRDEAAVDRVEASLWLTRAGRPEEALSLVRSAVGRLRKAHDDESVGLAMASAFLAFVRMGQRRRAKRTLLDLVMGYPVKQYPYAFEVLKEGVAGQAWLREDPDTAEMFSDVPVHLIERGAVNEIIARAREAYPNEFGAMLRGIERVTHIEPILDSATGRSTVMFSLFDRLSQRSVPGEGVVHSHPSGSTRPSKADLHMFSRFPGINIIIGYPFTEGTMAAYDRLGNGVELRVVR